MRMVVHAKPDKYTNAYLSTVLHKLAIIAGRPILRLAEK